MSQINEARIKVISSSLLEKGEIITILTSYCGGDNKKCTNRHPCKYCIPMCNTFELTAEVVAEYSGQVGKDT